MEVAWVMAQVAGLGLVFSLALVASVAGPVLVAIKVHSRPVSSPDLLN
jgi:hypothetical protein